MCHLGTMLMGDFKVAKNKGGSEGGGKVGHPDNVDSATNGTIKAARNRRNVHLKRGSFAPLEVDLSIRRKGGFHLEKTSRVCGPPSSPQRVASP